MMKRFSSDPKGQLHAKSSKKNSVHSHGNKSLSYHYIRMPLLLCAISTPTLGATSYNSRDHVVNFEHLPPAAEIDYKFIKCGSDAGIVKPGPSPLRWHLRELIDDVYTIHNAKFLVFQCQDGSARTNFKNYIRGLSGTKFIGDWSTTGVDEIHRSKAKTHMIRSTRQIVDSWFPIWRKKLNEGYAIMAPFYCKAGIKNTKHGTGTMPYYYPMFLTVEPAVDDGNIKMNIMVELKTYQYLERFYSRELNFVKYRAKDFANKWNAYGDSIREASKAKRSPEPRRRPPRAPRKRSEQPFIPENRVASVPEIKQMNTPAGQLGTQYGTGVPGQSSWDASCDSRQYQNRRTRPNGRANPSTREFGIGTVHDNSSGQIVHEVPLAPSPPQAMCGSPTIVHGGWLFHYDRRKKEYIPIQQQHAPGPGYAVPMYPKTVPMHNPGATTVAQPSNISFGDPFSMNGVQYHMVNNRYVSESQLEPDGFRQQPRR